ncbi:MAG: IclR family transcriptional regulator [Candidatus Dormibacter sp.]
MQAPAKPSLERPGPATPADMASGDLQVVARVADLLWLFARSREGLRLSQVSEGLQLQRTTAHRYIASLSNHGFLVRQDDGAYVLGPLLVHLGAVAIGRLLVVEAAVPVMDELVESVKQTVVLSAWSGAGPVVVRVQEDLRSLVHISVRVGSSLPPQSAQAMVFAAHLGDEAATQRFLASISSASRVQVEEQLLEVCAAGFATSDRVAEGIRTVGVPVRNGFGEVVAALAVVGTTAAVSDRADSGVVLALKAAAARLSLSLGFITDTRRGPE